MTKHRVHGQGNPFTNEALRAIFRIDPTHPDRLVSRESSWLEFKQAFNWNNNAKYAKTMAAFANNRGGYIVFGVGNKPRKLLGLTNERFNDVDPAEISGFLNSVLSPEIDWDRHIHKIGDKQFGLLYVWESSDKPVVAVRNAGSDVKEAEIYYRYHGRSERIKYSELRRLLEEKRASEEELWLQHISQIAKIGIEDVAILDLQSGKARAGGGTVLIDDSLVPQLRRIAAKPTDEQRSAELRIEGKIIPSGFIRPVREVPKAMVISSGDIIRAFLRQERVASPEQFIRQICFESTGYLPVYYFATLAGLNLARLEELVDQTTSRKPSKTKLLERVRGPDDYSCTIPNNSSAETRAKRAWLERIERQNIDLRVSDRELRRFLRTICTLDAGQIDIDYLFPLLLAVFEEHYEDRGNYLADRLRRTICHVDRVLYRPLLEGGEE